MSDVHPACKSVEKLLADCDVRHERRSGPGGQHRNKVSTAVVLIHRPTGLRAEANERRSQAENLREAVHRLRLRLAIEVGSSAASKSPSELWRSRTKSGKLAVNGAHEDFPALLAEALNRISAAEFDVAVAATQLAVTTSQLVKFLQLEPAAFASVNTARRHRGLHPLH
ncbi:MAG: peptide chain release factor-like protein [Pirellulales bacterium]